MKNLFGKALGVLLVAWAVLAGCQPTAGGDDRGGTVGGGSLGGGGSSQGPQISFSNGTLTIRGTGELTKDLVAAYKDTAEKVVIENGITSIGDSAFYGCSSLKSVTVNASTPPTLGTRVFDTDTNGTIISGLSIYVPSDAILKQYETAENWGTYYYKSKIKAK